MTQPIKERKIYKSLETDEGIRKYRELRNKVNKHCRKAKKLFTRHMWRDK